MGITVSCDLNYRKTFGNTGCLPPKSCPNWYRDAISLLETKKMPRIFESNRKGSKPAKRKTDAAAFHPVCNPIYESTPRAKKVAITLRGSLECQSQHLVSDPGDGKNAYGPCLRYYAYCRPGRFRRFLCRRIDLRINHILRVIQPGIGFCNGRVLP